MQSEVLEMILTLTIYVSKYQKSRIFILYENNTLKNEKQHNMNNCLNILEYLIITCEYM